MPEAVEISKKIVVILRPQRVQINCRVAHGFADAARMLNTGREASLKQLRFSRLSPPTDGFARYLKVAASRRQRERQSRIGRRLTQVGVDHHDRVIHQATCELIIKSVRHWISSHCGGGVGGEVAHFKQTPRPSVEIVSRSPFVLLNRSPCRTAVNPDRRENSDHRAYCLNPGGCRRMLDECANISVRSKNEAQRCNQQSCDTSGTKQDSFHGSAGWHAAISRATGEDSPANEGEGAS